jgi:NADH-quinone oxidoreductase subunit E
MLGFCFFKGAINLVLAETHRDQIDKIFAKYPDKRSAIMPLLYVAQEAYGYVSPEAIADVASLCALDPTLVKSIAGFYTMYRETPKGKFWLQVCTDLPCALVGADQFYEGLLAHLGIKDGETTADGVFTVEHVMCLAACDKAPMLQCNFHFLERQTLDSIRAHIADWRDEASK